jgi:hypothetical protein
LTEHARVRTFNVDEVVPVETKMPAGLPQLDRVLDAKVLAHSKGLEQCVAPIAPQGGMNGLLLTVHLAFAEHRPLTLSPDDVWMAILQGFAIHVRENAETLRERFVEFEGRSTLRVTTSNGDDWEGNLQLFERALAGALNPGLMRAITSDFSTTSKDTHLAFCIAAMDSFSRYFDYSMVCVCGIPKITLTGTVDDWLSVRDRFRVLAEYDLQWWSQKLEPVLTQFIGSAAGNVDLDFWQSIYKPKEAYGGDRVTGWIVRLFPYLEHEGTFTRNPFESRGWIHDALHPDALPSSLCSAPLRIEGVDHEQGTLVALRSGFFGVQQLADASLAPLIGWAAGESSSDQLLGGIAKRHSLVPSSKSRTWPVTVATSVPALLNTFSARFGGAMLYGGELQLAQPPEQIDGLRSRFDDPSVVMLKPQPPSDPSLGGGLVIEPGTVGLHIASLRDGRRLVFLDAEDLVLLADKDGASPPYSVIASSLLEFVQRLSLESQFPPWELKGTWSPKT